MRKRMIVASLGLALALPAANQVLAQGAAPAAAPDPFHVTYQYKDLATSDGLVTGKLLLTVLNLSGKDARDVAVSSAAQASLTFDGRELRLGDLANGQQRHRIELLAAPGAPPDPLPDLAPLTVRFKDAAGAVHEAKALARRVP